MPTAPTPEGADARRATAPAGRYRWAMLDEEGLLEGVRALTGRDPDLAGIVTRHGPPPLWTRAPGFATLVQVILEQQVSLKSAEAAVRRLLDVAGAVTPEAILDAGEERLRAAGLTRQKSRYLTLLAGDVVAGRLDLAALEDPSCDEGDIRTALTGIVGVGAWSADIYLLMALRRPDIWPLGDVALAAALRRAKDLPATPRSDEQLVIVEPWRPWRAVAARILWHAYLAGER
jgi:DNA-3-methyladenine glycosylase II